MSGCCDPSGYPGAFNSAAARRSVRSFEKNGLDSTAEPMVNVLRGEGLEGATVLEVGAGSATAVATMLDSGADRATAIDISPNYEATAKDFLEERGLADAVDWHTGDFVALADELPRCDVVFLNRVVCCYPDMPELVDAAAGHADRYIAASYPRTNLGSRFVTWVLNGWFRIHGNTFRTFVHSPEQIAGRLVAAGFEPVRIGTTAIWHWGVWRRVEGEAV
jgi:hypothetical protein